MEPFFLNNSKYADLVSQRTGVKITFSGKTAFTDGKRHINLPSLPVGSVMTPWEEKVFRGFIDHEAMHMRYTDFDVFTDHEYEDLFKKPMFKSLCNVIEDVRGEIVYIDYFPGTLPYLNAVCEWCTEECTKKSVEPKIAPRLETLFGVFYKHLWRFRDYEAKECQEDPDTYIPFKPWKDLIDSRFKSLKSHWDSASLARELWEAIVDDEDLKEEMEKTKGASYDQISFGELLEALSDALEEAMMVKNSDHGDVMEAFVKIVGESDINSDEKDKDGETQGKVTSNWGGTKAIPPYTEKDEILVPSREREDLYIRTKDGMSLEINQMTNMLRLFLQSRGRRAWNRGLDKGKLDNTKLPSLLMGNPNVFKNRRERAMMNTAVSLMIDASSSMDENATRQAMICISEALNAIPRLKVQIASFQGPNFWGGRTRIKGDFGRISPLTISLHKRFDEALSSAKPRIGGYQSNGGTPLGCSYGYAFESVVNRPEAKKVVWVVTDGDPTIGHGNSEHSEYEQMRLVHRRAKMLKIQTLGLGIGARSFMDYCDYFGYVNEGDTAALSKAVLEMTKGVVEYVDN